MFVIPVIVNNRQHYNISQTFAGEFEVSSLQCHVLSVAYKVLDIIASNS